MLADPPVPVASSSALLVPPAPVGPVQDGIRLWKLVPDETPKQTAQLGHGEGQQFGGEIVLVLSPSSPPEGGLAQHGEAGMRQHGEAGMRQHGEGDVAVPAGPGAHLVVVEPDFALGRLEAALDGPARAGDAHQLGERGRLRRMGQVIASGAWVR